jgi:hypothetical protein
MIKNKKNSVKIMPSLEVDMAAQISNVKMPKSVFAQTGYETPLEMYNEEPFFEVDYHPTEVPLNIMLRQSMAESSLRPNVVSDAGAIGLTQVMPGTLKDYIKATGHKDVDLYNYKDAMAVQNWYMNDLYNASFIDKPDQSDKVRLAKTLAAYNWGRGNMLKFLTNKRESGIDIYHDDMAWLQDLPTETREYLDKVLFNTHEGFQSDVDSLLNDPDKKEYIDAYDYKKIGGSLPKAQKGNEAITIMGDAARANEAGLDTKYSDLRGDQTPLTLDQAELIGGFAPIAGEIIDGKNVLKSIYEGNYGDAALHALGFAIPIVPGKAIKKGFGAGWDKIKGWWRGADDVVKKSPYKFPKWASRTVPVHGDHTTALTNLQLDAMKKRGARLDDLIKKGKFNVGDIRGENIAFHGTTSGRSIVEVALPGGGSQFFYKSTDLSSLAADSKGVKDLWQPFGGYTNRAYTPEQIVKYNEVMLKRGVKPGDPRFLKEGDTYEWFIKSADHTNYYGSDAFKDISNQLDKHMVDQGWDMSDQIILHDGKRTRPYKDAEWINKDVDYNKRLYEYLYGGSLLPKAQSGYEVLTKDPQVYIDNYNRNVNRNNLIESRTNDSLFSWDYWFGVPSYEESIYFDKNYDPTNYTRASKNEIDDRLTRQEYSTDYNFIDSPMVNFFGLSNKKPDGYVPQSQRNKYEPTAIELSVKDYMSRDMASSGFVNRLYEEVSRNLALNSDFNELSDSKKQEVLNSHVYTILKDRNLTNENLRYVRNSERSDQSAGTMFSMMHRNTHPFIRLNPGSDDTTEIHEGFHGLTHENYGLTQYAYDVLKNAKYTPNDPGNGYHGDDNSYLSDPTEVYVSKKNTENWLREKGIWDSQSGDPFTKEMFDTVTKMVKKGKASREVIRLFGNDELMFKDTEHESFNKKISWEDANKIMNTVAFKSPSDTGYPQEEMDIFHDNAYAQHGGAIRSAQEGEEVDETFTPQPGMYDPDQNTYVDLNDPNVEFPPEGEIPEEDDTSGESKTFSEAFAEAEAAGLETFTWNGKEYKVAHPENNNETTENTPENTETTEKETDVTESDDDKEVSNTESASDINAEDYNLSSLSDEQKEYLANTYGKVPHPVAGTSTGVSPTAGVGKPGDLMDLIYTVKGIADRFKSENYVKHGRELYRAQQGTGSQFPFNEEWSPDQPDSNIISNDQSNNNDNIMQDAPNQEVQNQTDFSIMSEDDDGDGIPNSIDADTANPPIGPQPQPTPEPTDNQDNFPFDEQDPNVDPNTDPNTDPNVDPDPNTDPQIDTTETTTDGGGSGRWQDSKAIQTGEKIAQGAVDAARFANAFLQRRADRKRKQNMKKTTLADNVYQTTEADVSGQKGDYDANTGIFRKDDKVIARQGKYGTELSKFLYSEGGRTEQLRQRNYHDVDTTLDLDEDTIKELMAAGAEIEYL